jgi:FkbH-like protein
VYGRADALEEATETFRTLATSLGRLGITPILQTVPAPPDPWCGHYDRRAAGSVRAQVEAVNRSIVDLAAELACPLLDCAELAARVGTTRWFDHTQWHAAKLPFALELTPLYADHVARILGAMCGRGRKALVLDLDNTLWGGVVGDDGLEGIVLGQGSGEGEAFLAVQRYALELKRRGVVLAVCSKNDEHAARAPFHRHPEMLLSEEDIAVFSANWRDKAANLRDIAAALNIGTDALVLMDDNPREREQVRQALPEAAVPELPDDPAWYAAAVAQAGYFETLGLTAEDAVRAEQYRANACRARALQSEGDLDAFHRSLGMHCTIRRFDALSRSRIAQLINKTNQFNLTTRRYTEADVAAIEADPSKYELQVRLSDRFGDNGMISVIVFDISGEEWVCDTWLMSCRVIGRRVEELVLDVIAAAAREAGARRLLGDYIPTAKNRLVETFWPRMGFVEQGRLPGGGSRWVLNLDQHLAHDPPITLAFEDGRGALAGLEGQRRPPSASPADAGR